MKKLLIVLMAISCQIAFSQTKKKTVSSAPKKLAIPPPIVRAPDLPEPPKKYVNKIISILRKNDFPMAFKFEINKDTIILPKQEFAEIVELHSDSYSEEIGVTIISKSAADTLKYEFNDGTKPERIAYSYYDSRKWCEGIATKEIIKATDKETKLVTSFKAILDKPKKKILYLVNVTSGRKYLPASYEPPAPSIGF